MSRGDVAADLRERLAALVAEAREAGRLDALRSAFDELAADETEEAVASARPALDLPGRYGLVGDSPKMREVFALIERVAPADVPVLVQGETGTGKELVAKALHQESKRRRKPFFAVNCAAVPAQLLESELFGHKRGSFTGAVVDREGHFVSADGGTVFLDEIGDMPLEMQSKLLRVLQEGEVRPVGSNQVLHVDVRLVAATHRDLAAMCREKRFREDLYFRLNVVTIWLPPLRERPGDVRLLAQHVLAGVAEELGRPLELSEEALGALEAWRWPGNVRELENELRRAAVFSGQRIERDVLSPRLLEGV